MLGSKTKVIVFAALAAAAASVSAQECRAFDKPSKALCAGFDKALDKTAFSKALPDGYKVFIEAAPVEDRLLVATARIALVRMDGVVPMMSFPVKRMHKSLHAGAGQPVDVFTSAFAPAAARLEPGLQKALEDTGRFFATQVNEALAKGAIQTADRGKWFE